MSSAKFASLHSGLLARKGLAMPAVLPLPIVPALARLRYADGPRHGDMPAPVRFERACAPRPMDEAPRVAAPARDQTEAPARDQEESCCGGAARAATTRQPARVLHAVRSADAQPADYDQHQEPGVEVRTHVSVRLNAEQLRRLKTAAAQLHVSQQKIMADGLEHYLDKLALEDLVGCRCLKAKT
jgi:hypothetical protein